MQASGVSVGSASIDEVLDAFHGVRAAVAELMSTVGVDPTKTRESARVLGLNRGLAWRLTRIVRQPESPAVVSDVPSRQSMRNFVEVCRTMGAPEAALQAVSDAVESYERSVGLCSGDRKTLAMLMANHAPADRADEQVRARRKIFEGACSVWGVQADVRFVTVFVYPSDTDPMKVDAGHVTGYVGFRRLSPRPWPMSYEAVHRATGEARRFRKEPLEPEGVDEGELQLLKSFCDPRNPKIEVTLNGDYKRFELAAGPVGNEGLTTCVFGSHLRELHDRYSEKPDTSGFMVLLQTPVERVVFDMFVHRDLGVSTPPATQLLDRLTYPHNNDESQFDRQALPLAERPVLLPPGVSGAMHPEIPWYTRMLQFVTERIRHGMDEFIGSRFEMAYPPISTTLSRRFDLLPPPDAPADADAPPSTQPPTE
ncbi:MAG: hypothetical protein ACTS3F_07780 [Phycisphaerales bacterium]